MAYHKPQYKAVQTNGSTGSAFVPLEDCYCQLVILYNQTGTSLTVRGPEGLTFEVVDKMAWPFLVRANANELAVKRTDDSTSQVTANYTTAELYS